MVFENRERNLHSDNKNPQKGLKNLILQVFRYNYLFSRFGAIGNRIKEILLAHRAAKIVSFKLRYA